LKRRVAFVVEKEIRRAVARVEVGRGIVILIEAEIIGIEAKINVKAAVVVVVGDGRVSEGSLRSLCEFESVGLELKFAVALIQKQLRACRSDDKKILQALVFEIGE